MLKNIITKKKRAILENLRVEEILTEFGKEDVFDDDEIARITRMKSTDERRNAFVNVLMTKPDSVYWVFLTALCRSGQRKLMTMVESPGKLLKNTKVRKSGQSTQSNIVC